VSVPDHCGSSCHGEAESAGRHIDWLLSSTLGIIAVSYLGHLAIPGILYLLPGLAAFGESVFTLMNTMAWGIAVGIIFFGLLGRVPREIVIAALGQADGVKGIFRAMLAGVLLDLCSHGILMIGARLYERGASVGQVMAFLIASPWNSVSLTLILWALVGFRWMLAFLLLSMVIAMISGVLFEHLVKRGNLPANPHRFELPEDFHLLSELKALIRNANLHPRAIFQMLLEGLKGSRVVLRWVFLGVTIASLIRTAVPLEHFQTYFGATLAGLGLTLVAATVIEVCSEGTVPIAADLLTRANAPGNSFAFLMTGVSTDYTEIMVLKETTASWSIPLLLPAVTVPQVVALALVMNTVI